IPQHNPRAVKILYLMTVIAFTLGLGVLVWGTPSRAEVTLLGMTFHPRIAKSVGLVMVLLSVITLLALFGSSLQPHRHGRRIGAARCAIRDRDSVMDGDGT